MKKNNNYEYFIDIELDGKSLKLLPDFEASSPSLYIDVSYLINQGDVPLSMIKSVTDGISDKELLNGGFVYGNGKNETYFQLYILRPVDFMQKMQESKLVIKTNKKEFKGLVQIDYEVAIESK